MRTLLNPTEVINFFGDIKRGHNTRAVLSIHGGSGTGKSTLATHIGRASQGVNVFTIHDTAVLVERFDEAYRLEGMRLLIIDGDNYPDEALMKHLLTSDRLHVEVKGRDSYTIKNQLCGIVVMTTAPIESVETTMRRRIVTDIDTAFRCFALSDLTT